MRSMEEEVAEREALSLDEWLESLESEGPYVRCVDMISSFRSFSGGEGGQIAELVFFQEKQLNKNLTLT